MKKSAEDLAQMLEHTLGGREVPVIVHADGRVEVGWDGGT